MDKCKIKDLRTGSILEIKESKACLFLYRSIIGRVFLKLITKPFISNLVGRYMSSSLSKRRIKKFIIKNNINMSDYKKEEYNSFNDFFVRKIKKDSRKIPRDKKLFISPCDGKLSVYKISMESTFIIKDSYYRVEELIENKKLAKEYMGGYVLIFRLCVDDYHRYIYLDSGYQKENNYIKGILHTVRPVVLNYYNIYKQNSRQWTILHTDNFSEVIQVEVGALMVGKIKNHKKNNNFSRGEEKGMFLFGGSTIVLLVKENIVQIDEEILKNTRENIETVVKLGHIIGKHN